MKRNLILVCLIIFVMTAVAQEPEQEFVMGGSIQSDSTQTYNRISLLKNLSRGERGINGLNSKDDKKYGRYGIDISHYQGNIVWKKLNGDSLPNKVFFIVVKATQGKTLVDNMFDKNFKEAKKNGYITGAYHFYSQAVDPESQAENFIQHVPLEKGDLMPVLDIERNCLGNCATTPDLLKPKNEVIKDIKTFIKIIEEHYNTKIIIYTGEAFYRDYLQEDFKNQFFWIASYSKKIPKCFSVGKIDPATNPCASSMKGCWQYSQSGKMKGVAGDVDINYMNNYYLSQWLIQ
jgi:lysozyme